METIKLAVSKYIGFVLEYTLQLAFFGYTIYLMIDLQEKLNDIKEHPCLDKLIELIHWICALNIIISILDIFLQTFNIFYQTKVKDYDNSILIYHLKEKKYSYLIIIPFIFCFIVSLILLLNDQFDKEQSLFCQNKLHSQYQINKITLIVNILKIIIFTAFFSCKIYQNQQIEKMKALCYYITFGCYCNDVLNDWN